MKHNTGKSWGTATLISDDPMVARQRQQCPRNRTRTDLMLWRCSPRTPTRPVGGHPLVFRHVGGPAFPRHSIDFVFPGLAY
jgi:hypothetical protein